MTKNDKQKYTLGEEIVNAVTHGIGALFGIVALVLTIIFSVKKCALSRVESGNGAFHGRLPLLSQNKFLRLQLG